MIMEHSVLKRLLDSPDIEATLARIEKKIDLLLEKTNSKNKALQQAEMLDVSDVAKLLKVCHGSVYNWVSTGKIAYCKVNGRLLFNRSEVEALLRSKNKGD